MKFKFLITLTVISIFTFNAFSQKKNIINIGAGNFLLKKDYNLDYERLIKDKQSFLFSLRFSKPYSFTDTYIYDKIPLDKLYKANVKGIDYLVEDKYQGFSITPQYRFYKGEKEGMRGFYIAPFIKYANYSYRITVEESKMYEDRSTLRYTSTGAGVQFGVHWLISDLVSIDWSFLGLEIDRNVLSYRYTTNREDVDFNEMELHMEETFENYPYLINNERIKSGDDFFEAKSAFIIPWIRTNITLGIAF